MAAPSSAYTAFSLFMADCEHGQAVLSPDYSTFKTRFYLDEVIGGKEGVVGCVTIGGLNASYHNLTTRGGKGRVGNMQVLNDGGLNTKASITSQDSLTNYIDDFKVTGSFKSAFYSNNLVVGVRYRISFDGGSGSYGSWIEDSEIDVSSEAPNTTFSKDIKLNSVNFATVSFDSKIEWQLYIINEEGRTDTTTIIEENVQLIPILLRTSTGGSPQTYYTNTNESQIAIAEGSTDANRVTQLWTSSTGLAPYLPYFGVLFRNDDPDIQYTFDTATVDGDTRSNYLTDITDIGIPDVSWIPVQYIGFGNTTTQACNKAALGTEGVTYYINSVTLLVHASVGGAFPTNQYYIDFSDEINYRIIQITDGVRTDTGSTCSI